MKLPVRLLRNGVRQVSGSGETLNLSSGGVLFVSNIRLETGDPIEYVIAMPVLQGSSSVTLHCLGKVTRVDPHADVIEDAGRPFEVAATLERYEFVRSRS